MHYLLLSSISNEELEKDRVAAIKEGKRASKTARKFARKPFTEAANAFLEERRPKEAERTTQFEKERVKPLLRFFGDKPLLRITGEDVTTYQNARLEKRACPTEL